MGTYRKEWDCCGSVTETQAWEPDDCPFCSPRVTHTNMASEQAEKWAWEQVKRDVGTEGWTVGDSCNYFGFFLWGWRYRAQYESQSAPAQEPGEQKEGAAPLTRCAASRDGECGHAQCPQLRDGEPRASGRHCPLDVQEDRE